MASRPFFFAQAARSNLPAVAPNSQSTRQARLSLVVAFMLGLEVRAEELSKLRSVLRLFVGGLLPV